MHLPEVNSIQDLISLAILKERQAVARFNAMAGSMRERDREDLAKLFDQLAVEADLHEAGVWRTIDMDPPADGVPAADDATEAGEVHSLDGADKTARQSLYECLADAVRSEEEAFGFFSYIAANAADPLVREKAEALAREELEHAHQLRQARRKAYHEGPRTLSRWPQPHAISDLEILRQEALLGETTLCDALDHVPVGPHGVHAVARASNNVAEILAGSMDIEAVLRAIEDLRASNSLSPNIRSSTDAGFDAAVEKLEDAFEFYDGVAETAGDEDVRLAAQGLCTFCVERLKILRAE